VSNCILAFCSCSLLGSHRGPDCWSLRASYPACQLEMDAVDDGLLLLALVADVRSYARNIGGSATS
jgi:hypothetical protein